MGKFILSRFLQAIIVCIGITAIAFVIMQMSGDPIELMLPIGAPEEQIQQVREALGLDRPLPVQYFNWLSGLLRLDFGRSLRFRLPTIQLVLERLPKTFTLVSASIIFGLIIGGPLGVLAARAKGSLIDWICMIVAIIGQSAPTFWLALTLVLVFSVRLNWLPAVGAESAKSYILPIVTMGVIPLARIARMTRSSVIEVLDEDYIRTARSKGLSAMCVLVKHALSNAARPVLTDTAMMLGRLLGGAIVIESVFAWPGLGSLLVTAMNTRDFPLVQTAVLVLALSFVILNAFVDILYALLDPRIRY